MWSKSNYDDLNVYYYIYDNNSKKYLIIAKQVGGIGGHRDYYVDLSKTYKIKFINNKKYSYKACYKNILGNEKCSPKKDFVFKDMEVKIKVVTSTWDVGQSTSINLTGYIKGGHCNNIKSAWFEFSDNKNLNNFKKYYSSKINTCSFSYDVYNLDGNKKYFYRACALSFNSEKSCGDIVSVKTNNYNFKYNLEDLKRGIKLYGNEKYYIRIPGNGYLKISSENGDAFITSNNKEILLSDLFHNKNTLARVKKNDIIDIQLNDKNEKVYIRFSETSDFLDN